MSSDFSNRIYASASGVTLTNEDNLIEGAGQIGVNLLSLVNRSVIEANNASADLRIDPNSGGMSNRGTLRAVNGATLELVSGNFENFESALDGLVEIDASELEVTNSTLTGGAVTVLGSSLVRLGSGTITGGTLDLSPSTMYIAHFSPKMKGENMNRPKKLKILVGA